MTFGIDFDDVLCPFIEHAVAICNKANNTAYTKQDINTWGFDGNDAIREVSKYYGSSTVLFSQKVSDEAVVFMKELQKKGDVYIITAVKPEFMSFRAAQIKEAFPFIADDHILMGVAKNLVKFDVTLDDAPHNILKSCADYPVLFRQPWNASLSGVLSVNSYDDFLVLIDQIKESMSADRKKPEEPAVIALVGPSGSNKNAVVRELCKEFGSWMTPISNKNTSSDDCIVKTVYAGHEFALSKKEIERNITCSRKSVVLPVDMCGAMTLKRLFKNVVLIFCKCSRETMIGNILNKDIPNEEKKIRLLSLEQEIKHKRLCDFVIDTEDPEDAVQNINNLFL